MAISKKTILLAGVVVVALGGGGAGWFLLSEGKEPAKQIAAPKKEEKKKEEIFADMEPFVVNLASNGTPRYLRTSLSLALKDEHEKEKIKKVEPHIRHDLIMTLSSKRTEELLTPEGKLELRKEMLELINAAIGEKIVSDIYFREFIIQ